MTKQLSLKEKYNKEVVPQIIKEFGIKNKMLAPKIEKIVVNAGVGQVAKDKAKLERLKEDIAAICGQAPSLRKAKTSIAGFNLREGLVVGLKVTLRSSKMYDFLARLFTIVLPRLRDFRGIPVKGFDESGNYTLGIIEHSVFPEVDTAKSTAHGMEITVVMNTKNPDMSKRFLELMGMPFEKEESKK